ncbi:putative SIT4 phosphatase-associated protein family [Rosa chinensis]|uniref:Putative SIT4 phosphatase-associated protein family n=1 Tax=Rosa chinensis TaxID=74649 RepID=A0A2P6QET3_ROSCH|nr:putative SIT4 phosphatase-associated protein family [Rosa chinensis]
MEKINKNTHELYSCSLRASWFIFPINIFGLSTCGIILRRLMPCYLGDDAAMCCLLKSKKLLSSLVVKFYLLIQHSYGKLSYKLSNSTPPTPHGKLCPSLVQSRGSQQGSNSMEHGRNSQFSLRLRMVSDLTKMDSLEVHVNAAETLCAITRLAPPGLATKICNPSFIQRLLQHAMEDSQRKSVLTSSLSVCISLLDREREALRTNACTGEHQPAHGSTITVNNEIVVAMLNSLGDLLKLLDVSSADNMLLTTYGKLQPPLGKHRLKIVEFISVLLSVRSQAAEKELIRFAAIQKVLDLFFKYPYNNFLHHHIENIIISCLESKNGPLVQHILRECDLVGKILEAEKNFTLAADSFMPTIPAKGRSPPRNGNIGHLTCISNKIIQLGNNNREIQAYLQENSVWTEWHTEVLLKRNAVENVSQWACGRPISSLDRGRSS